MPRKKTNKYLEVQGCKDITYGHIISQQYESGNVSGWKGEKLAKEAFDLLGHDKFFVELNLPIQADGVMMLYQCCRKAIGSDTKNYPQQIGDCVSFGAKNASEYLICVQKVLGVSPHDVFHPVFPPYLYGCGRVFIGGDHGYGDGSVGVWQAKAVEKYGVLAADESNVPAYSGSIAKKWGGGQGPAKEFVELGQKHLVKSAAKMNSWNDVVAAVSNGYPVIVCSGQGFSMEASSDGFHRASGSWAHCMCIMGVNNKYKTPYGLILNSWGDVHGHLKDFDTQEELPVGVIRARAETIERMIRQDDTFAFSQLPWFKEQKLPADLFKLL